MLWRPGRRYLLGALKPARKDSGFGCLQSSFEDQPLVSLSWIRFAAATPSAAAFTISAPPFAQSPPTKTLGWSFGHLSAGIDGGIAGADDHDLASDGRFAIWVRLEMLDERERIDHARQVFARNAELLRASQSDPHKDGVILVEQRLDRIDRLVRSQLHTEVENVLHFGEGDVGLELVLRDPVRVETAR